jgi:hypothetical protein
MRRSVLQSRIGGCYRPFIGPSRRRADERAQIASALYSTSSSST